MEKLADVKKYISKLKTEYGISVSVQAESENSISAEALDKLVAPISVSLGLSSAAEPRKGKQSLEEAAIAFIQAHFKENITSEIICRHLKCSRSLLSHRFKKATGMSIREYITELRINCAKSLLENTDLSVTEASSLAGFGSSNYFSNVFKEKFNTSPAAYKNQIKQNN